MTKPTDEALNQRAAEVVTVEYTGDARASARLTIGDSGPQTIDGGHAALIAHLAHALLIAAVQLVEERQRQRGDARPAPEHAASCPSCCEDCLSWVTDGVPCFEWTRAPEHAAVGSEPVTITGHVRHVYEDGRARLHLDACPVLVGAKEGDKVSIEVRLASIAPQPQRDGRPITAPEYRDKARDLLVRLFGSSSPTQLDAVEHALEIAHADGYDAGRLPVAPAPPQPDESTIDYGAGPMPLVASQPVEVAPAVDRGDWTCGADGRSNTSGPFHRLVGEVTRLIRDSAHDLIAGRAETVAGLIMAQLAHVHRLAPPASPVHGTETCSTCHRGADEFGFCSNSFHLRTRRKPVQAPDVDLASFLTTRERELLGADRARAIREAVERLANERDLAQREAIRLRADLARRDAPILDYLRHVMDCSHPVMGCDWHAGECAPSPGEQCDEGQRLAGLARRAIADAPAPTDTPTPEIK